MTTVCVVFSETWSGYRRESPQKRVEGVFATLKAANAYIKKHPKDGGEILSIKEYRIMGC